MVKHREDSIKAMREKEAQQGGTSAEDKAKIQALEKEVADLTAAINSLKSGEEGGCE